MKKNKVIVILSHCNTEHKQKILIENIGTIRKLTNCRIVLTSHITLPQNIIEMCDYFVFDKSNPILTWPERTFVHWKDIWNGKNFTRLSYSDDDYGWTPFNQISKGISILDKENYEMYYFINYDIVLNEEILNEINNNEHKTMSYTVVNQYGSVSNPSLIFFKIKRHDIKVFNNNINLDVYKTKSHAEKYFEHLLNILNTKKSEIVSKDSVDFGQGMNGKNFNHSLSEDYSLFVANYNFSLDKEDYKLFFYDIKENLEIIVDDFKNIINKGDTFTINNPVKIQIKKDNQINDLEYKINKKYTEIEEVTYKYE